MTPHLARLAVLAATWIPLAMGAGSTRTEAADLPSATWDEQLKALETLHADRAAHWPEAIRQASSAQVRDSLEALVPVWKQKQRREWLALRLEQERARGDQDKVARLEAELARVVPPAAPPATSFVPREEDRPTHEAASRGGAR